MNIPFPTDKCPLCGGKIVPANSGRECGTSKRITMDTEGAISHYRISPVYDNKSDQDDEIYQHVVIMPFLFETALIDEPDKTWVYRTNDGHSSISDVLIKLPRITDWSNPDKLVDRVKKLIPFT